MTIFVNQKVMFINEFSRYTIFVNILVMDKTIESCRKIHAAKRQLEFISHYNRKRTIQF